MGKEAPKELREPRLSFMDGETLKLCMYLAASETEDREAGISMELPWSPGMARVAWLLLSALPF